MDWKPWLHGASKQQPLGFTGHSQQGAMEFTCVTISFHPHTTSYKHRVRYVDFKEFLAYSIFAVDSELSALPFNHRIFSYSIVT
jgi:hypothetical protein